MKATIWHNPKCSKSRGVLALLQEREGVAVEVVEYLKNPPERDKLAPGISPAQGLRLGGTDAKERGLPDADADTVLDAMAAEPKLIERPLVETEKGVRLCRPVEKVEEIL